MEKTHLSLYYLAGYLFPAGILFTLAPAWAMRLFLSTGVYDDIFPRLAGLLLLALGVIVVQIIRHRLAVLYPATLIVRIGLTTGLLVFYSMTRDPMFLILSAVVLIGIVLTGTSYLMERR